MKCFQLLMMASKKRIQIFLLVFACPIPMLGECFFEDFTDAEIGDDSNVNWLVNGTHSLSEEGLTLSTDGSNTVVVSGIEFKEAGTLHTFSLRMQVGLDEGSGAIGVRTTGFGGKSDAVVTSDGDVAVRIESEFNWPSTSVSTSLTPATEDIIIQVDGVDRFNDSFDVWAWPLDSQPEAGTEPLVFSLSSQGPSSVELIAVGEDVPFSASVRWVAFTTEQLPINIPVFSQTPLCSIFIDDLFRSIRDEEYVFAYDLNFDDILDDADVKVWVEDIRKTYLGDSNLDGEINSSDFVSVFQAGEYEDGIEMNSGWADGDWNGDGEFDSGDFVAAFSDGGYEIGPRNAVIAVPEPSSVASAIIFTFVVARRIKALSLANLHFRGIKGVKYCS